MKTGSRNVRIYGFDRLLLLLCILLHPVKTARYCCRKSGFGRVYVTVREPLEVTISLRAGFWGRAEASRVFEKARAGLLPPLNFAVTIGKG